MRIILVTDPPWVPTANSKQMVELARSLQADMHTVYWMPVYGFSDGGVGEWENIAILPGDDNLGNNIIKHHVRATASQLVITRGWAEQFPEYGGSDFAWWAWHPGPVSRRVLRKSTRIVAVSQEECRELEKISGVLPFYSPRGIGKAYTNKLDDPDALSTFRVNHGITEDNYVFSAIGPQNPHWKRMLDAFKEFHDRHAEAVLYMHTDAERPLDLIDYCKQIGLTREAIKLPHGYDYHIGYYDATVAAMYRVSNVHLVPGLSILPILESLACGTPVLTTDRPEAREVMEVDGLGALVPPSTMHEREPLLDVDGWVREMEAAYRMTPSERANHAACCQMLTRPYHWRPIFDETWRKWLAIFEQEERDVLPATVLEDARPVGDKVPLEHAQPDDKRGTAFLEDRGFDEELGCDIVRKTDLGGNVQDERALNAIVKSWGPHPNIIPILREGTDEFGRYFFDTPKLAPLRQVHNFSIEQGDKILADLREGLAFMHEHGAAHCDINPRNVLLSDSNRVGVVDCPMCELTHAKWEIGPDMRALIFDFDYMQSGLTPEEAYLCDFEPLDPRVIRYAVPVMQSGLATRGFHRVLTHVRNLDFPHSHATAKPDMPYQQIDGVGERDCDRRWAVLKPDVNGKRVVDLGCNLGYFANRALEEGAASVMAVDRDRAIVEAARTLHPHLDGNVRLMNLDRELPEGEFDIAFCLSIWQHLRAGKRPLFEFLKKIPVTYWEDANMTKPDLEAQGFTVTRLARSERGRNLFRLEPRLESVAV